MFVAYISRTCGACQRLLHMVAASPKLLAAVDLRTLEDDPRWVLEMHDLGMMRTPSLAEWDPTGARVVGTYQGAAAYQRLIQAA